MFKTSQAPSSYEATGGKFRVYVPAPPEEAKRMAARLAARVIASPTRQDVDKVGAEVGWAFRTSQISAPDMVFLHCLMDRRKLQLPT